MPLRELNYRGIMAPPNPATAVNPMEELLSRLASAAGAGSATPTSPTVPEPAPPPTMEGAPEQPKWMKFAPVLAFLLGARKPSQMAAFLKGAQQAAARGEQGRQSEYERKFEEWKTKAGLQAKDAAVEAALTKAQFQSEGSVKRSQIQAEASIQRAQIAVGGAQHRAAFAGAVKLGRAMNWTKGQMAEYLEKIPGFPSVPKPADSDTPITEVTDAQLAQDFLQAKTESVQRQTGQREAEAPARLEALKLKPQDILSQISKRKAETKLTEARTELTREQRKKLLFAAKRGYTLTATPQAKNQSEVAAYQLAFGVSEADAKLIAALPSATLKRDALKAKNAISGDFRADSLEFARKMAALEKPSDGWNKGEAQQKVNDWLRWWNMNMAPTGLEGKPKVYTPDQRKGARAVVGGKPSAYVKAQKAMEGFDPTATANVLRMAGVSEGLIRRLLPQAGKGG